MGYVPAKDECGILTVDKLPSYICNGDPITKITKDEVIIRTQADPTQVKWRGLWIAKNSTPDILDAEFVG